MGRSPNLLPAEKLEDALGYFQRAVDRGADFFTCGNKETSRSLARLRRQALTLRRPDFVVEANAWLNKHVTPDGRRAMLTALRQHQFVERNAAGLGRSIRLTATSQADVVALAECLGMSPSAAVAAVSKAALADRAFLANIVEAAVPKSGRTAKR